MPSLGQGQAVDAEMVPQTDSLHSQGPHDLPGQAHPVRVAATPFMCLSCRPRPARGVVF